MDRRDGFTLVELLIVIGIVALLMAILVPVVSRASRQAKAIVCQSKLRQWGLAFSMYADVNNNRFFSYRKSYGGGEQIKTVWIEELRPYYKEVKLCFCPMAKKIATRIQREHKKLGGKFLSWSIRDYAGYTSPYDAGSYGLNMHVCTHRANPDFWKDRNAKGAAYIPLLLDANWYAVTPDSTDRPPAYDGDPGTVTAMNSFCINRHHRHVNGVFLDQSVRKIGLKELWKLKWYRGIDTINQGPSVAGSWPDWMRNFKDY